ncbi:MAG: membrane dipeptidase [Marinilabiliales bacterium]|nr:MAG: membrane dipeptidase [Marinilabiliales bacterium]
MRITGLLLAISMLVTGAAERQNNDIAAIAAEIHSEVLTLDTHTDTPLMLAREGFDIGSRNIADRRGGQVDFPRMFEGGLDAAFFAVFLGQGERTPEGNQTAKERALQIFELIHQAIDSHPSMAGLALEPDDAYRLKNEDMLAIYIGLENGYPIGRDINLVDKFYDLGARYITLSHSRNNDICDSSTDPAGPEHGGLSDFGIKVVRRMNDLGMIVDVSHISDEAFYDVLKISRAPVAASHSNARAVCDHPRNLDDDMLIALRDNGGVIQVCILSSYVKTPEPNPERDAAREAVRQRFNNFVDLTDEEMEMAREAWFEVNEKYPQQLATVADLVDHIDHIVDLIGIDHVGIGTDFDGGGSLADCRDVTEIGNITFELVSRGYSREDIEKIWAGNFMRVFRKVEKLAAK